MTNLNTYNTLQEAIVFASLENKVLSVLRDGITCVWLERKNLGYIWAGDYTLPFDIFAQYPNIKNSIFCISCLFSFTNKSF